MRHEVRAEMLEQIVKSVFTTMLELEVSVTEAPQKPAGSRLASFVQLTGDWNGTVLLECSPQQACALAGRVLCMDPPSAVDDDVRDAMGELANVIGGNIKSGMSVGVSLSMPIVMDGKDYDLRVCGAEIWERLNFECTDGPFWVTVLATFDEKIPGIKEHLPYAHRSSDEPLNACSTESN